MLAPRSKTVGFVYLFELLCCITIIGLIGGGFSNSYYLYGGFPTIGESISVAVAVIGMFIYLVCCPLAFMGSMHRLAGPILDTIMFVLFLLAVIVFLLGTNLGACRLLPSSQSLSDLSSGLTADQAAQVSNSVSTARTICQIYEAATAFLVIMMVVTLIGAGMGYFRAARVKRAAVESAAMKSGDAAEREKAAPKDTVVSVIEQPEGARLE